MNCIEFRHICITTPDSCDTAYLTHLHECCSCAMFARETGKFNHHLHEAVNVSPPPELAARILLRQSLSRDKKSRLNYYFSSGLAACLLLVIGMIFITSSTQEPTLEQAVTTYINNNSQPPITGHYVQDNELERLFKSVDMKLDGDLGIVSYAMPCYIREQISLHLIIAGTKGPVTVLMMPESTVTETIKLTNTRLNGIIVPCPKGSMAILGISGEALDQIESQFRNAINWNSA
jgi:Protein of unknown function (DUF3379)